jgi:hypothetical protein
MSIRILLRVAALAAAVAGCAGAQPGVSRDAGGSLAADAFSGGEAAQAPQPRQERRPESRSVSGRPGGGAGPFGPGGRIGIWP